jgi:acyl-homoserine lactone acylase PvdQ
LNKLIKSFEFIALGINVVENFTVPDVLAHIKLRSFLYDGNRISELERFRLLQKGLTIDRINSILPRFKGKSIISETEMNLFNLTMNETIIDNAFIPDILEDYYENVLQDPLSNAINSHRLTTFSSFLSQNIVALSGKLTKSGKPMMSYDISAKLSIPSPVFLIHLKAPGYNVIGGNLPGIPIIVSGRNDHIAWGSTTSNGDAQGIK